MYVVACAVRRISKMKDLEEVRNSNATGTRLNQKNIIFSQSAVRDKCLGLFSNLRRILRIWTAFQSKKRKILFTVSMCSVYTTEYPPIGETVSGGEGLGLARIVTNCFKLIE